MVKEFWKSVYICQSYYQGAWFCWFFPCYNTRMLNAKLSLHYFTYLLFNLRFIREQ